jgi:hypothetical protein
MGTLLKETKKVAFTTLSEIRTAFTLAFSTDCGQIKDAINDRSLFVLSTVRNVLVHKAGVADEEFCGKMKRVPAFAEVKKGDPLRLDGEVVAQIASPAMTAAVKLIEAVDAWLTAHPEWK